MFNCYPTNLIVLALAHTGTLLLVFVTLSLESSTYTAKKNIREYGLYHLLETFLRGNQRQRSMIPNYHRIHTMSKAMLESISIREKYELRIASGWEPNPQE